MKINIPTLAEANELYDQWRARKQVISDKDTYRGHFPTKGYILDSYRWHLKIGGDFYQSYIPGWFWMSCSKKPPYKKVLDIGANAGFLSIPFSTMSETVESFEPHPDSFKCLKKNTTKNKIKNIQTHNVGIMDFNGQSNITSNHWSNSNTISENGDIKCQIKTIDSFSFTDVDIIKIDTEGNELNILNGGHKTIEKYKPYIIVEPNQGPYGRWIYEFMSINGLEEKINFKNNVIFGPKDNREA